MVKIWTLKKEEKIHARKKKTRVKLLHILKGLVRVIEKQHQRGGAFPSFESVKDDIVEESEKRATKFSPRVEEEDAEYL